MPIDRREFFKVGAGIAGGLFVGGLGGCGIGELHGNNSGYQEGLGQLDPTVSAGKNTINVLEGQLNTCETDLKTLRDNQKTWQDTVADRDKKIADLQAQLTTLQQATPVPTDTPIATPEPTQCPPGENSEHQKLIALEREFNKRNVSVESGTTVGVFGRSYTLAGIKVDGCNVVATWSAYCPVPEVQNEGGGGGEPPKNPPENPPEYPPEQ